MNRRLLALLVCIPSVGLTAPPGPISGRALSPETTLPADVLARADWVRAELEVLRFHMGRPKNRQTPLKVTNAAPREVFFQAITLFRKANRLSFEITRTEAPEPETPSAHLIRPVHVWHVTNAALERILIVKQHLGLAEAPVEEARDTATTPSDVFAAIVQANRQVNLLLDRRLAPSDVFQKVTLAVNYAARLLAVFPEAIRIPRAPTFEAGKRPVHVYRRLLSCFEILGRIAEQSGISTLRLEQVTAAEATVTPSDVYDIASLIVSELAYVHSQLSDTRPPARSHYPGLKFPSHVFQRAGLLKAQLTALEQLVTADPTWLMR